MIDSSNIHALETALGSWRPAGVGEYQFNCPFCIKRTGREDTKHHLYVNPDKVLHNIKGWYYCQRCGARGSIQRILKDADSESTRKPVFKSDWDNWLAKLKAPRDAKFTPTRKVTLPEDYVPCYPGTEAYEYLKSRGIDDSIIAEYKIGFGYEDLKDKTAEDRRRFAGAGRIVFPDFGADGEVVYWVARTYRNHRAKYKNPPNSDSRDKLYSLARAAQYRDVVVTEGPISAIAAGMNAVATYGKGVTDTQVAMLDAAGFDTYYLALDGDALKTDAKSQTLPPMVKLARDLKNRSRSVRMVIMPYEHDPASVDNFDKRLETALPYDFSLEVKLIMEASR